MAKKGMKTEQLRTLRNAQDQTVAIVWEKREGEEFKTFKTVTLDFKTLPQKIQAEISLYGLARFVQDRSSDFTKLGKAATLENVESVYKNLQAGVMNTKRASASKEDHSVLIAVIAETKGKPVAAIAAFFAALPAAKKAELAELYADRVAQALAEAGDLEADDLFDLE